MIRFHQTFGAHAGRTYEFDKEQIRFGRQPDSDVAFDPQADLDASGRHAEVRRERGQYYLVDSGSRNGTWLNGHRVDRAVLSSGDEIEFGHGGPRMRVELVHFAGSSMQTGPMTPAPRPAGAPRGAATPIAADLGGPIDPSGVTMAATPLPGPGGVQTPIPMNAPASSYQTPREPPAASWGAMPASAPSGSQPEPAPGTYGHKTVGMMIDSAVERARQESAGGANRSTAFIRAVASEAASHSSRGLKIVVGVLGGLLVLALVGLVVMFVIWQREADESRRQTERLQTQVDQRTPAGSRIAAAYEQAIFLLVESRAGQERGICSAFSVRPDLLATNAHCVLAMEQGLASGATYQALPNAGRGSRLPVQQMWHHPEYVRGGSHPSADVGILRVGGQTPVQVVLANMQQLAALQAGTEIFVFGFPGDLANVGSPVATITDGVVGRMTAFDGTGADLAGAQLIQHSAFTSAGTSGSPIFDDEGLVVAINAGTFRSPQQQEVIGPLGPQHQTVMAESGYKYGVRIDLLASLLAGMP
jgi:predicted component of type VI protein secretion system